MTRSVRRRVGLGLCVAGLVVLIAWLTRSAWGTDEVTRLSAPAPAPLEDSVELPPPPSSVLSVPIHVDLDPLVEALEGAVPRRWGSLDDRISVGDDGRKEVAVELRRDSLDASLDGSTATATTTIHYRVRGWYDAPVLPEVSASCGTGEDEPPPRLGVRVRAPITLTRDWALRTRLRLDSVAPASAEDRDRCTITIFDIDVTGTVLDAARDFMEGNGDEIDRRIAQADIRSSFESWWDLLLEPIDLADETWLVLAPERLRRGAIEGKGDALTVTLNLVAHPRVVLGSKPATLQRRLPPLDTGRVEPGLNIEIRGRAEYESAGRRLTEELAGSEFSGAGQTVRLTGVQLQATTGGRLAVAAAVEGDVQGRLFLVGTPEYDPATGMISVPDLGFDVATSDAVVAGASWLVDAGIEGFLREQARVEAAPAIDWASGKLHEGLNRELADHVRLEGEVGEVRILGVTVTRDAFLVRASARAEASLLVEPGA